MADSERNQNMAEHVSPSIDLTTDRMALDNNLSLRTVDGSAHSDASISWSFSKHHCMRGRHFSAKVPDQWEPTFDPDKYVLARFVRHAASQTERPQIVYDKMDEGYGEDVQDAMRSYLIPETRVQQLRKALYANGLANAYARVIDDWLLDGANCQVLVFEILKPSSIPGVLPDSYEYLVKPVAYGHEDSLRLTDTFGQLHEGELRELALTIASTVKLDEPVELRRVAELEQFCRDPADADMFRESVCAIADVLNMGGSERMNAELWREIRRAGNGKGALRANDTMARIQARAFMASLEEEVRYFGRFIEALERQAAFGADGYDKMWMHVGEFADARIVSHVVLEGSEDADLMVNSLGIISLPDSYQQLRARWEALRPNADGRPREVQREIAASDDMPAKEPEVEAEHNAEETQSSTKVHPTSDKTWRNAEYDLTKVKLEAALTFYRTRFEIQSRRADSDAFDSILLVLLDWITSKEKTRLRYDSNNLLDQLPEKESLTSEPFGKGGLRLTCAQSYLCTETASPSDEEPLPAYWALEYVERDSAFGYRFWITEIGLTAAGHGNWVFNARVRYYDDPTYIYQTEAPQRSTPRFVRDLILSQDLIVKCGGLPLGTSAIVLAPDNFDPFVESLIDQKRTAPIVVVSRHSREGTNEPIYPVDPIELARLLTGVAAVYALDRNNEELECCYRYVFDRPDKPAYKYRLEPGCLRIFWGGVDLDEPTEYDYARHRFFTSEALEAMGARTVIQNISVGVSRMFSLKPGEVLGIRSVAYQASLIRTDRLEQNRRVLTDRLREAEKMRVALEAELEGTTANDESLNAYRNEIKVLNELLATADSEIAELEKRQGQTTGGVSEEEFAHQLQSLDRAEREAVEAMERAESLTRDNDYLRYRIEQLETEVRDKKAQSKGSEMRSELLFELGKELREPAKAIGFAKKAFADRLYVMDEAARSADDFKGDAGEMFAGLAALYKYLWPMRFEEANGMAIDEDAFKARSGFAISFHEGKHTNRDPRLVKLRQRSYRGNTCDITPHLKGGNRTQGLLRIHFFFDDERRLIVVGHCGNHLETYGTQRL